MKWKYSCGVTIRCGVLLFSVGGVSAFCSAVWIVWMYSFSFQGLSLHCSNGLVVSTYDRSSTWTSMGCLQLVTSFGTLFYMLKTMIFEPGCENLQSFHTFNPWPGLPVLKVVICMDHTLEPQRLQPECPWYPVTGYLKPLQFLWRSLLRQASRCHHAQEVLTEQVGCFIQRFKSIYNVSVRICVLTFFHLEWGHVVSLTRTNPCGELVIRLAPPCMLFSESMTKVWQCTSRVLKFALKINNIILHSEMIPPLTPCCGFRSRSLTQCKKHDKLFYYHQQATIPC